MEFFVSYQQVNIQLIFFEHISDLSKLAIVVCILINVR